MVKVFECAAAPLSRHEVVMRRALPWKALRKRLRLVACREHIEYGVQNLADFFLTRPAAALVQKNQRLDQRPFGISQIARIPRTAAAIPVLDNDS